MFYSLMSWVSKGDEVNPETSRALRQYINAPYTHKQTIPTVYWHSSISDPNCFAVIELVATEINSDTGIIAGQYGCGWSMMQPFGDGGIKDISTESKLGEEGFHPLKVYSRTPRKLRFLTKEDYYRLDEIAVPSCRIRYKINTHEKLMKVIRSSKLFSEVR